MKICTSQKFAKYFIIYIINNNNYHLYKANIHLYKDRD